MTLVKLSKYPTQFTIVLYLMKSLPKIYLMTFLNLFLFQVPQLTHLKDEFDQTFKMSENFDTPWIDFLNILSCKMSRIIIRNTEDLAVFI